METSFGRHRKDVKASCRARFNDSTSNLDKMIEKCNKDYIDKMRSSSKRGRRKR